MLIPKDLGSPHIAHLENDSISHLAQFSGLILVIILVILAPVRLYVAETILPRIYKKTWSSLDDTGRRNFVNHHMAAGLKFIMLVTQVYPLLSIMFGHSNLHTPLSKGSIVTTGDMMIIGSQIFISMYVFELFYRARVSYISTAHHIAAIVIAQSAVAIGLNYVHEKDATIEFVLVFVWGMFDVMAEFWPHIALLLYRIYPERHYFLAYVFRLSALCEVVGTTLETALVMWFFASLWHKWTIAFKIVTPLLHILFSIAQLWGAIVFWRIAKKELRLCNEDQSGGTEETGKEKGSSRLASSPSLESFEERDTSREVSLV